MPTLIELILQEQQKNKEEFMWIALGNGWKGKKEEIEFKKFCNNKEEYLKQKHKEKSLIGYKVK